MTLRCNCTLCGNEGKYELNEKETDIYKRYLCYGRQMGMIQDLFPNVPNWIRSGAIDTMSGGFCICPECGSME